MKYVAYYRVSTKRQGESGLGLEAQKQIVSHYFDPSDIVQDFTEVASAKDIENRPLLKEAIKLCNDNGYALLVAKTDRLSRKTEDALQVFNKLEQRLHSCDIPQEKGAKMDKFTLTLFMAIADRERELISLRTKQALAERKRQGVKLGNPKNLDSQARAKGSQARKDNAAKSKANRQAALVANGLRTQGMSYRAIADKLNEEGFTTRRGKEFQATSVMRLIAKESQ